MPSRKNSRLSKHTRNAKRLRKARKQSSKTPTQHQYRLQLDHAQKQVALSYKRDNECKESVPYKSNDTTIKEEDAARYPEEIITKPEACIIKQEDPCEIKKPKLIIPDKNKIISNVFRYLDQEYKFMMIRNTEMSTLSILGEIDQRTAAATGVSVHHVHRVMMEDRMRMEEKRKIKGYGQRYPMSHQDCASIKTEIPSSGEEN